MAVNFRDSTRKYFNFDSLEFEEVDLFSLPDDQVALYLPSFHFGTGPNAGPARKKYKEYRQSGLTNNEAFSQTLADFAFMTR
jgi:hypothetical protein